MMEGKFLVLIIVLGLILYMGLHAFFDSLTKYIVNKHNKEEE